METDRVRVLSTSPATRCKFEEDKEHMTMSTYHTKKQRLSTEAAIATISTDGALITMIQNNTHLTLHAYLKTNSDAYEVTNMWDVDVVVPKRNADRILKIENPWHHHEEKVTFEGQRKERQAPL